MVVEMTPEIMLGISTRMNHYWNGGARNVNSRVFMTEEDQRTLSEIRFETMDTEGMKSYTDSVVIYGILQSALTKWREGEKEDIIALFK
jgi:hypothetical protein